MLFVNREEPSDILYFSFCFIKDIDAIVKVKSTIYNTIKVSDVYEKPHNPTNAIPNVYTPLPIKNDWAQHSILVENLPNRRINGKPKITDSTNKNIPVINIGSP